jgi:sialic acid synthase SpsE
MSTPFDEESADFLNALGVPAFKISSGDLTNTPLLAHVARFGLPVILSTGMATLGEVEEAARAVEGIAPFALLQCVSNYPADAGEVNLRAMRTLGEAFKAPVGYSDHTLGVEVALAAVALGACIVEKHFTLDSALPGPDHRASLEPPALRALVSGIRAVERALGDGVKRPRGAEIEVARVARKSLFWNADRAAGASVDAGAMIALRPSTGLAPGRRDEFVGRVLARDVRAGEPVRENDFV